MKFDINRVYTALNADELKVGSKVYTADCLGTLQELVEAGLKDKVTTIREIESVDYGGRFYDGMACWHLAYLVSEPEEKKLKWTDLKLGDVIRNKELPFIKHLITGIDEGARDYVIQVGRMNGKSQKCLEALIKLEAVKSASTETLLKELKDRGVIRSWYYNGSYHIGNELPR